MQNLSYEQWLAYAGMSVLFIFFVGMFISVWGEKRKEWKSLKLMSQDKDKSERIKIFEHRKMLYNNELEDTEIPENDIASVDEVSPDDDFIHPHPGVGSSHAHHVH